MKSVYPVLFLLMFIISCGNSKNNSVTEVTASKGFKKEIVNFDIIPSETLTYESKVTVSVSAKFSEDLSELAILTISLNGTTILSKEVEVVGSDYNETFTIPLQNGRNYIIATLTYLNSSVTDFAVVDYITLSEGTSGKFNAGIGNFLVSATNSVVSTNMTTVSISADFNVIADIPAQLSIKVNGNEVYARQIFVDDTKKFDGNITVPLQKGENSVVVKMEYLDSVVSDFVMINFVDTSLEDFIKSINVGSTGYRVFYLSDSIHAKVTDVTISYNTTLPVSIENIEISADQGESWISAKEYFSEKSYGTGYAGSITFSHLDIGQFKPIIRVIGKVNGKDFFAVSDVGVDGNISPRIEHFTFGTQLYTTHKNFALIKGWFGKNAENHFVMGNVFIFDLSGGNPEVKLLQPIFFESATEREYTFSYWIPPSIKDSSSPYFIDCTGGSICAGGTFMFNVYDHILFSGYSGYYYYYNSIE